MSAPLLIPWSENVLTSAVFSVVGATEDANFPLSNLVDCDQQKASKLSGVTGMWVFDFGAPVHLAIIAILHHNFDASLPVELRGYAVAPTLLADAPDLSVSVIIRARGQGYYRPNAWADVDAISVASYRYWALAVTSPNTSALTIGELFASSSRFALPDQFLSDGDVPSTRTATIEQKTYGGGSFRSQKEFPIELFSGTVIGSPEEIADVVDIFLALLGRAQPAVYVPDDAEPNVFLVLMDVDELPRPVTHGIKMTTSLQLRELSRGLAWP